MLRRQVTGLGVGACLVLGAAGPGCTASSHDEASERVATTASAVTLTPPTETTLYSFTNYNPALCDGYGAYNPSAAWPGFGGCATNRRSTPQVGTVSGYVNWKHTTGGSVQSSPAIDESGNVYFGSNDGKVYAVTQDNVAHWPSPVSLGASVHGSPAIGGDGTVYVGADNGFYMLAPTDGHVVHQTSNLMVRSAPVIAPSGTIYFAATNSGLPLTYSLYGKDSSNNTVLNVSLATPVSSSPAVGLVNGTAYVYVATDGVPLLSPRTLYGINTATHSTWTVSLGGNVTSLGPAVGGPAVAVDALGNATIYVGGGQLATGPSTIVSVSATGTLNWAKTLPCSLGCYVAGTPAIGPDGNVYFGTNDGHVYSYDPAGNLHLSQSLGGNINSSVAIDANGTIYVGTDALLGSYLYALQPSTVPGAPYTQLFATPVGNGIESSPAIGAYGTVYVGCDDDKLYSVGERYTGFTIPPPAGSAPGTPAVPTGTCIQNQVPAATATSVCLTQGAPTATTVNIYVNGHLAQATNGCVAVTVGAGENVEVRSFEYDNPAEQPVGPTYLVGSHLAFLTTTANAQHCPIYADLLLGTPGDDVLIGTHAGEYISGGAGFDYIVAGGGSDVLVSGDSPHTFDLTRPLAASQLPTPLKIVGANLSTGNTDVVLVNFDPTTVPTTIFDPQPTSCPSSVCQYAPPSFEHVYANDLDQYSTATAFTMSSFEAVRQSYDTGGGYIAVGSRSKSDRSATEGLVVKLTTSGTVAWKKTSSDYAAFSNVAFNDVQDYYDVTGRRAGYVLVGNTAGTITNGTTASGFNAYVMVIDLQGNLLSVTPVDCRFFDASGNPQGQASSSCILSKVIAGPSFVVAVGSTYATGSTQVPGGSWISQSGTPAFVAAYANHFNSLGQLPLLTAEGFAPQVSTGSAGFAEFVGAAVVPPSGTSSSWQIALGGDSIGPSNPLPSQSAFLVLAQLGPGLTGTSGGSTRITPLYENLLFGGTSLTSPSGSIAGIANDPYGTGLLFAGSTNAFEQNNPFSPSTFLVETSYSLQNEWSGGDPNAGYFFDASAPGASGYEFLGGYSRTYPSVAQLDWVSDNPLVLGQSLLPWSYAALSGPVTWESGQGPGCPSLEANCGTPGAASCCDTTGAPSCIWAQQQCQLPVHALSVTGGDAARIYQTYGHDTSNPATHAINTFFAGGELTPDHGFVSGGSACPGIASPCSAEAYAVKAGPGPGFTFSNPSTLAPTPAFQSPGLPCSCNNGYADCGESPTGYIAGHAHPGDCGGPCATPCDYDCGDGVQDHGEGNVDCGGICDTNAAYTPLHDLLQCGCDTAQCAAQSTSCTSYQCATDPDTQQQFCQATAVADLTSCPWTSTVSGVCLSGVCGFDCRTCVAGTCQASDCSPQSGCSTPVTPNASCQNGAGTCSSTGQCVITCDEAKCSSPGTCQQWSGSCDNSGNCTYGAVADGTPCGNGKFCLNGTSCELPTYANLTGSSTAIFTKYCGSCHSGSGSTCTGLGGNCLATSYANATAAPTTSNETPAKYCAVASDRAGSVPQCIIDSMTGGYMPAVGVGATPCSTHSGTSCPTSDEIAVVQAWVNNGTP
jgi:outer membrane protein assembly factor BamB